MRRSEPSQQGRFIIALSLSGVVIFLVARAGFSQAQEPSGHKPVAGATDAIYNDPGFAGLFDPYPYDPRGRRDPFAQVVDSKPVPQGVTHGPLLALQQFDVSQLKLTGIIWDVRKPKAMIQDPQGHTHIVGLNTKLGPRNGYIAVIREGEMVVVETVEQDGRLLSTAQVVKIAK